MIKGGVNGSIIPPARGALCALILAAGLSTRMKPLLQGGSKALCDLQGKLLLERCCGVFKKAGLERIYVVTGHESGAVGALAQKLGAIPLYNANFQEGMFSSIKAGLQQLAQNSQNESFFLLPVDIPLLKPALLEALISQWEELGEARKNAMIIPEVQGNPGHPPLIGRGHWSPIMQWSGEGGLQGYVASLQAMTGHESQGGYEGQRSQESKVAGLAGISAGEDEAGLGGASQGGTGKTETAKAEIDKSEAVTDGVGEVGKFEPESLSVFNALGVPERFDAAERLGIYRLNVHDKTVLWDIDTPDDLEKAALYLKESGV